MNQHFHPLRPVLSTELIGMNGVTALGEVLAFALANQGDAIMVSRPIYGRFEVDFGVKAGVKTVYAEMGGKDPLGEEAVEGYERALKNAEGSGVRVRGMLISNPHNPLGLYSSSFCILAALFESGEDLSKCVGRCYTPESLRAVMAFCGKHNIHVTSDEIYALSIYDSGEPGSVPFTSVLSLETEGLIDEKYVHVLYGLSKVSIHTTFTLMSQR
jgi:1-aminocyclopropane-1-carboxylate synthase